MPRLLGIVLAQAICVTAPAAETDEPSAEPVQEADTIDETPYLRAGMAASVHGLDSTLSESKFADWMQRAVGGGARIHWEVNDCGEGSGSSSDSARDLPVCVDAQVVLSGGRELWASILVGTVRKGAGGSAHLWWADIAGPDTTISFHRLSDLERYLERERPITGDSGVYLDNRRNVHVVTLTKKDVCLTKEGRFRDPKLSPDGRSIGMLATSVVYPAGGQTYERVEVVNELWIYRGGRVLRRLTPGGSIRAWSFANNGEAVGTYSVPSRSDGFYVLYDVETGFELDQARDPVTDRSPKWVRDISP